MLTVLQILDLSTNQLTGPLPVELFVLTSIQQFVVGANMLNGTIPTTINWPGLTQFDVHKNMLTSTIPSALAVDSTQILDVSMNVLSGSIPVEFASVSQFQSVNMANNMLSGTIPNIGGVSTVTLYVTCPACDRMRMVCTHMR